jgi:hypothetical protein
VQDIQSGLGQPGEKGRERRKQRKRGANEKQTALGIIAREEKQLPTKERERNKQKENQGEEGDRSKATNS